MSQSGVEGSGGCLCGAVRYTLQHSGEVSVCHCRMCQRLAGGPMFAVACVEGPRFEDESAVGRYRSSEQAERGFCRHCGSQLFFHNLKADTYAVTAGMLDDPEGLVMTEQIWMSAKPGFYELANETRRMDEE
ncbi:GFA family protein [Kushneria phosphatilytica]|uniref:GFA family protein n=1 Tax=Kushneria phosphatilytica TaxID=657387 RepID=A0A1S1NWV9_9GAMM|nr:GFA family protein [Kushneria phosphatilytica]OHV08758.1 hypothetical protein BH688_12110 [Kushneria phosphatilytica]QEL12478.1 GFA family protein [Kushneria phosphatilytica]